MKTKYNLQERTPKNMQCGITACPAIIEYMQESYLIVGEQINPSELGLEQKVVQGEVLIKVPKKLIDQMEEIKNDS